MKSSAYIQSFILIAALVFGPFARGQAEEGTSLPPMKPSGNPGEKPAKVPSEEDFGAYLFVFHQDSDHSLHMALSYDGYTFTALNGGQAVMSGRDLAEQKGIRDPYIARGPDGGFYLGMTDLHIFARREGLRDTQWERPGELYDWGNNRALVFMKSYDLINWTHTIYHVGEAFETFSDVGCLWAPQMIYDETKGKMMVSFTTRFGKGRNKLYYAYADDAFTQFVTEPEELFQYPRDKNIIDSDITKVGDQYHLFYVAHDQPGGIRHAVSDRINGGYAFDDAKIDPEKAACEAPSVWKRIGTDTYVLMYDVFGVQPHNFGFSETTDFKTFTSIGRFNEGVMKTTNFSSPKHGAIIPVTKEEADRLARRWGLEKSSPDLSDEQRVEKDFKSLQIPEGYANSLRWNIPLKTDGESGSEIRWKSANPEFLADDGTLLRRAPQNGQPVVVKLGARISSGAVSKVKVFDIRIAPEDPPFDGYLFAYFEGGGEGRLQEQLRFGVSTDAVHWSALNDNEPILDSSDISQTGGIRDPHLLRGEDQNAFYMVATDMFTRKNGWGSNPGIVMLKSDDLINWKHGIVDLAKDYPEKFGNVHWVWAPQTIYDPNTDSYLVYFTVRYKDDTKLDLYAAHANEDFTGFVEEPFLLFRARYGSIDGDIVYKDGLYHLFYKGNTKDENGHEFENGIQQAVSQSLYGPYEEDFKYLDAYARNRTTVEGSSVFKLNDEDTYVLMYDLYSSGRYEYQTSTDLFNFTEKPQSFTKDFHPRHGSVIGITREEARRLDKEWGGVPEELLKSR